jgi:RND family efflux transporter MFP subunit
MSEPKRNSSSASPEGVEMETDRSPNMKSYRTAFLVTLALSVMLFAALGITWWRTNRAASPANEAKPAAIDEAVNSAVPEPPAPPASTEAKLVPIQLPPESMRSIGLKTGEVQFKLVQSELRTVGDVEVDEQKLSYVQLRFPGWIQQVFADSTYQYIRKGQPLFTIYSPDLVATEQEYLIARRNKVTMSQSTVPGVASSSASLMDAAAERLKQWQIPQREIDELEKTGQVRQQLEVDSPVSGYITERNALPNQYVQPETKLYSVADLSTVWVYAAVFQNDIGQLTPGDPATVTTDAYPGRLFRGRLDFIWPQVDMTTRTVRVRLVFPNPGLKLKPGMYVNVTLGIPLGRQLTIPASGVLQTGTRAIVFVDRGGGYFEPRDVELGPAAGDEYIVRRGLKAGEHIVTSANFLIDSESQLKAAMGSLAAPPPPADTAAAGKTLAKPAEFRIEFSTDPATARKGNNRYLVKLTAADGSPVIGAQVSVRSYMPGMPAMGMAEMNLLTPLSEKGSGIYQGKAELGSGGTWQITITAQKNGAVVAAKQLRLQAEGGM